MTVKTALCERLDNWNSNYDLERWSHMQKPLSSDGSCFVTNDISMVIMSLLSFADKMYVVVCVCGGCTVMYVCVSLCSAGA